MSDPSTQSMNSTRFPGYTLIEMIGQGGMGAVYEVEKDNITYALKTILASRMNVDALARFEREAVSAAAVDKHPNIVSIHKLELNSQPPFIVMDYVECTGLDQFIKQGEPWSLRQVIELLEPLASALDHMHSKGVIHRDLKPANILIRDHDGAPMITDFGIAKEQSLDALTKTGEILGTPDYMAPEQFSAEPISFTTDIWAFAVITYQLLTRRQHPFFADSTTLLAQKILFSTPNPIGKHLTGASPDFDRLFAKAFSKKPEQRYQDHHAFLLDLKCIQQKKGLVSQHEELRQRTNSDNGKTIALSILILILLTTIILTLTKNRPEPVQRDEATIHKSLAFLKEKQRHYPDHLIEHILASLGSKAIHPFCAEIQEHCQKIAKSKHQRKFKDVTSYFLPCIPFNRKQFEHIDRLSSNDRAVLKSYKYYSNNEFEKAVGALVNVGFSRVWGEAPDLIRCASYSRLGKGALALKYKVKLQKTQLPREFNDLILSEGLFESVTESRGLTNKFRAILDRFHQSNDLVFFNSWRSLSLRYCESMLSQKNARQLYNIYKDLEKLEWQYHRLPRLKLTVPMLKLLLTRQNRQSQFYENLYFHYQIQRVDPKYRLPDLYKEYCQNGRIYLPQIQIVIFDLYYSATKKLSKLLDLMLFCSRSGLFTESYLSPNLSLDFLQEQIISNRLRASPSDPHLRAWRALFDRVSRGINLVDGRKKRQYLASNKKHLDLIEQDLNEVLRLKRLPQVYQALLHQKRAEFTLSRYSYGPEQNSSVMRTQALADIRKSFELGNPFAHKLFRSYRAILISLPRDHKDFKTIRQEANKQFDACERMARERAQLKEIPITKSGDSYYLLEPLNEDGAKLQRSALYYERALLYDQIGESRSAQSFAIHSCSLAQTRQSLGLLQKILRHTRDVDAIQSIILPMLKKSILSAESLERRKYIEQVIIQLQGIRK
ncbi:MAG: serine/threonine-protein kinase [Planctomycetota bacterium]|nr:serine/threonine-protein kinase [Planctomycetota bacterium]